MSVLVGEQKIYSSLASGEDIKVLDPACGTGGFLVFLMQDALERAELARSSKQLTKSAFTNVCAKVMQSTFFGSDANEGVACAAKMNMIVAGDGHTNIQPEDSLSASAKNWSVGTPNAARNCGAESRIRCASICGREISKGYFRRRDRVGQSPR